MHGKKIRIVSRNSKLAQWQTNFIAGKLSEIGLDTEVFFISTDNKDKASIDFTTVVDDYLINGKADLAVHSLKDVNMNSSDGLCIAALSVRHDPSDVLIIKKEAADDSELFRIKTGAVVGTSSKRRQSQLNHFRKDIKVKELRGNVDERIESLRDSFNSLDGIIIAKAGIDRLEMDLSDLIVLRLHPREFIPAPGQGVIACKVRTEDLNLRKLLSKIHDNDVALCTNVERSVLKELGGVCKSPVGVFCEKDIRGSYHCFLTVGHNDEIIKVKYSQSTTFGLAEQIIVLYQQELKERI